MTECDDHNDDNDDAVVLLDSREAIHAAGGIGTVSESNCKKIILRSCHLSTTTAATIVKILRKNKGRIEEIVLDKCTGRLDIVLTVAFTIATSTSVTILLGYPPSTAFDPLAHSIGVGLLTNSSLSKLRLDIGSNRGFFTLTSDAASSLEQGLTGNATLTSLWIDNCRFAESSALRVLAAGLRRAESLRHVRLASCYEPNGQALEDRNIAFLIRALEQSSKLERLDVSGNKCLDDGIHAVASLVDRTRIKQINLSSQRMDRNEFMNPFPLVGALGRTSTLQSLNLRSNNLSSDFDMANLVAGLTHNTSVKHVDLSNNNVTNSAMNILSSKIPLMKVLESLWIEGTDASDDDASFNLATAMKENTVIRVLNCDQNLADYKRIQYYADLNWGGRGFLLRSAQSGFETTRDNNSTDIPPSLWPAIFARIGEFSTNPERRANVIFFLLQRGPSVFPI